MQFLKWLLALLLGMAVIGGLLDSCEHKDDVKTQLLQPAKPIEQPEIKDYSHVAVPYDKKHYPKLYTQWGDKGLKHVNDLMPKVINKVAKSPKCDEPEIIEVSDKSTPKVEAIFFVDCKNHERFYVSEKQLNNNEPLVSEHLQGL